MLRPGPRFSPHRFGTLCLPVLDAWCCIFLAMAAMAGRALALPPKSRGQSGSRRPRAGASGERLHWLHWWQVVLGFDVLGVPHFVFFLFCLCFFKWGAAKAKLFLQAHSKGRKVK